MDLREEMKHYPAETRSFILFELVGQQTTAGEHPLEFVLGIRKVRQQGRPIQAYLDRC